jgi:tetratricopeptide (TPR) repeat protein
MDQEIRDQLAQQELQRAVTHYGKGDLADALEAANRAWNRDPAWPVRGHVLHALAVVTSERGNREAALAWWTQFFAGVDGTDFPVGKTAISRNNYGYTLRLLVHHDEAMNQYRLALPDIRRHAAEYLCHVLTNVSWTACLVGDLETARETLDEAETIAQGEDVSHVRVGRAMLLASSGFDDAALRLCDEILEDDMQPPSVRAKAAWIAGRVLLSRGNRDGASAMAGVATSAVQGDPSEARLMYDIRALEAALSQAS